ncbi:MULTISPECIES: hypothetical protein [Streptomyces]|uniref:ParB/Sulfiredoxin domain-containing protein n=1 Tax=Streptomyces griseocarneus TaxID=51201 RepID=A0ABX7RY13_9ACTN|nr:MULTISPECIES: hypothetical protein [Streptomyces]QSY51866.1 hypothetical protein J3S04_14095 [Streptomyces griseocarneus]
MPSAESIAAAQFPTPRVVIISPEMAREITLQRNPSNRPVDRSLVARMVKEIQCGSWQVTHQGIALDGPLGSGRLVDGQHRLHAIAKSGIATPLLVFENVPRETFSVLDTGKRRNGGDTLAMSGERDATLLSSTIRHVHLFRVDPNGSWTGSSSRISNDQILEVFHAQAEDFRISAMYGRTLSKEVGFIPTAASTAHFLTMESAPAARIDDWMKGLTTGANLDADDPRLALIKALNTLRSGVSVRRRTDTRGQIGLYIKAWNAWVTGRPVKSLRLQNGEKMPRPVQMLL